MTEETKPCLLCTAALNMMYDRLKAYKANELLDKAQTIQRMIKDIEYAIWGKE